MKRAGTAAVLAAKPAGEGKTRMNLPGRDQIARALISDTPHALATATDVLVLVTDDSALASHLTDDGLEFQLVAESGRHGLNRALALGAEQAWALGVRRVLACVGDLPALRPQSVRRILAAADPYPRSFLADHHGIGTTMLIADGRPLAPQFEGGSAMAHEASGAVRLNSALDPEPLDATWDVDTESDLTAVVELGVGHFTHVTLHSVAATNPLLRRCLPSIQSMVNQSAVRRPATVNSLPACP